jgi:hypothetical protein
MEDSLMVQQQTDTTWQDSKILTKFEKAHYDLYKYKHQVDAAGKFFSDVHSCILYLDGDPENIDRSNIFQMPFGFAYRYFHEKLNCHMVSGGFHDYFMHVPFVKDYLLEAIARVKEPKLPIWSREKPLTFQQRLFIEDQFQQVCEERPATCNHDLSFLLTRPLFNEYDVIKPTKPVVEPKQELPAYSTDFCHPVHRIVAT